MITKEGTLLEFMTMCQLVMESYDENGVKNSPFFRQRTKNHLARFISLAEKDLNLMGWEKCDVGTDQFVNSTRFTHEVLTALCSLPEITPEMQDKIFALVQSFHNNITTEL